MTESQSGFTNWKAKFRQAQLRKRVRSLQRQIKKHQWNKESETDTPQAEAHQPYRNREKDTTSSTDLRRQQQGKPKKAAS
jgi:hypothetical protein